jgi:hypothetical protein
MAIDLSLHLRDPPYMRVFFLIILGCFTCCGEVLSQNDDWRLYRSSQHETPTVQDLPERGKIRYIQDERIALIDSLKRENPAPMDGYRVQLFFGSRGEANQMRSDFIKAFPERGAYVNYLAPNFRLRVGDFRSKAEAEKFRKEILSRYPGSYIVKDQIGMPMLPAQGQGPED